HSLDLHRGDGRALERAQEHPPERVAQRRPEAALERFRHELAVGLGEGLGVDLHPPGLDEIAPVLRIECFSHDCFLHFLPGHATPLPVRMTGGRAASRHLPCQLCCLLAGRLPDPSWRAVRSVYFEYNSTMSCSWIGMVRSSRLGTLFTVPFIAFLS